MSRFAMIALALAYATAGWAQQAEEQAAGPLPETPSVETEQGTLEDGVRTFRLEASEFEQQIANFPLKVARVWGYNGSTPGPTLVAYEGEPIRIVLTNNLPEATTIHLHGLHEPNEFDGVAGISQQEPIQPGESFTYGPFVPGHAGSFAYHAHTRSAVQELRGLNGMIAILPAADAPEGAAATGNAADAGPATDAAGATGPATEAADGATAAAAPQNEVDRDIVMVLEQFAFTEEGALVDPFPGGTGDFPFSTINGKTGEASGGPIEVKVGDRIRLRLYNASNLSHSMHLHGSDMTVVSANGHPVAPSTVTTLNLAPGDFFEVEFTFEQPGNWAFHCHVPHHTSNDMQDGWNGAPVGMTRIFTTEGFENPVPHAYFEYEG